MKSIISLILIATSVAFFVFFTRPTWEELGVNKKEVEKMNIAAENAKNLKSKIDSLISLKNNISVADTQKITKMLPPNVENVKLIIDFDKTLQELIAQRGTADIYRNPTLSNPTDFSIENPTITKTTITPRGDFDASQLGVADFTFSVSLTYSDFLDFLKRIESSTRIFDIESISFTTGDPTTTTTRDPNRIVYNFNVALKTYWLNSK